MGHSHKNPIQKKVENVRLKMDCSDFSIGFQHLASEWRTFFKAEI